MDLTILASRKKEDETIVFATHGFYLHQATGTLRFNSGYEMLKYFDSRE